MTDLADYLDEALAPDVDDLTPWQIDDEGAADWAAMKVQKARRLIAEKQALYDQRRQKLDDWLARETKALEDDAAFFEIKLADWLRREIEADDSKKPRVSRDLPCGARVKRTPPGESLIVDDEDALTSWLRAKEPDLVEVVAKYSKADVKKLVTKQGVKVPGVHIEPGTHGWKVDV